MNITLEKKDATQASLKVRLEEADYRPQVGQKLKEYSRKASIKGFRPGKVPPALIQKMYGKGILIEEVNQLLTKSVNDYIKENKLNLVGEPLPDVERSLDIDWDTQKEFEFSYDLGLAPDFTVDLSENVRVTDYEITLDDQEVANTIEKLREQYSRPGEAETAEAGDTLAGVLRQVNGEFINDQARLVLNEEAVAAELLPRLVGLTKDSQVTFDPAQAFPSQEALARATGISPEATEGLTGEFSFTVGGITRPTPSPLDQEFFDRILGKDAAQTEAAFRDKLREIIIGNYRRETDALLNKNLRESLVRQNTFDLPDEFLKRWLLTSNEGKMTAEQVEGEYDLYARELRWSLIKTKIAEENGLKVEHEEVTQRTRSLVMQQFGFQDFPEAMESTLERIADNFLKAEKGKNYLNVFDQVFSDKVLQLVREKITLEKKAVGAEEFKQLALA
ncbi:MAG: trigger factor [Ferruginibacter sp.]|nr:trigger factor [Cytophagales bacterium]